MNMKTKIQWCDSTVNPTMGCDGCELWNGERKTCYAGMLHLRYGKNNSGFASTFEDVTQYPGRMQKAARWSDLTGTSRPGKPWLNLTFRRCVRNYLVNFWPPEFCWSALWVECELLVLGA